MDDQPPILVIGAGGHGRAVLDVARSSGVPVIAFVDAALAGRQMLGVDVVASPADIALPEGCAFFVAIGDNALRQKTVEKTLSEIPGGKQAALVHATAYVSPFSSLAPGSIVMGNAFVGPNCAIGEGCILNTGSQIDHDGEMRPFSSLGPKACLGGTVRLGLRSIVGIGATVKHGVQIGDDSLLAAQSYLHESMPDKAVYRGIPAKQCGNREAGDKYL